MTDATARARSPFLLDAIYYATASGFALYMFYYYWTGIGGETLLALGVVPITYVLFTLQSLRDNDLYPNLPRAANYLIGGLYCAFSLYCSYYMTTNYVALGTERMGMWNTADLVVGGLMTLLIIEYARRRHMPLFVLNLILILYAVYGYVVPGMFYHAGLSWERVIAASSVEMETGIFARLRLRRFAAAHDQADRAAFPACDSAVGGDRLHGDRYGERIRRGQFHHRRLRHDPGDDQRRTAPRHRCGHRELLVDGRTIDAAGDGHRRVPAGGVPGRRLFRCRGPRLGAGLHLLRFRRDVGIPAGHFPPHPHGCRPDGEKTVLARQGQSRRLRLRRRRIDRPDGHDLPRADVRGALHVLSRGLRAARRPHDRHAAQGMVAARFHPSAAARAGFLHRHDHRHHAVARRAVDHRRADEARLAAGRGRRGQHGGDGGDGVHLRRHSRLRAAAGTGLHPRRDRHRPALHQGRRQSLGGALLRLLHRRLRRAYATHFDHRGHHLQDRQRFVLYNALAFGTDLRVIVHADGRRLRAPRTGGETGSRPVGRCLSGAGRDRRHHLQPAGRLFRDARDRLGGAARARGHVALHPAVVQRRPLRHRVARRLGGARLLGGGAPAAARCRRDRAGRGRPGACRLDAGRAHGPHELTVSPCPALARGLAMTEGRPCRESWAGRGGTALSAVIARRRSRRSNPGGRSCESGAGGVHRSRAGTRL